MDQSLLALVRRAGEAGHGERDVGCGALKSPLSHGTCNTLRDSARVPEERWLDPEHLLFCFIGVGYEAAFERV